MSQQKVSPVALISLLLMLFLAAIDTTILSTAMPKIVNLLGYPQLYHWVFTAFMLTSTLALPFYGKLADEIGIRRCMLSAGFIFLIGSALCTLAPNMLFLIVARAIQGVGAAGISGLTMIAFGVLFPPEERGSKQSLISMVWGFSSLAGPVSGGYLVAYLSWRWIFGLNVLLGVAALLAFALSFPGHEAQHNKTRLDWVGSGLMMLCLSGLLGAASLQGVAAFVSYPVLLALLAGFVWQQRRSTQPIIPMPLFADPVFSLSSLIGFSAFFVGFAGLTYIPFYLQNVLGYSPEQAGLLLTPMMVAWPSSGALMGFLLNRWGVRRPVLIGTALSLASMLAWLLISQGLPLPFLALWCILLGAGMGCLTAPLMVAVQSVVAPHRIGVASSTLVLLRNIGSTLGISLLGSMQAQTQDVLGLQHSVSLIFGFLAFFTLCNFVLAWRMPGLSPAALHQQALTAQHEPL